MAFGNYEFPHSHNYDSDLRELIALVNKYRSDYDEILSTVDKIERDFETITAEFEALTTRVNDLFAYVDESVSDAMTKYRKVIDAEVAQIREEIETAIDAIAQILPAAKAYADAQDEVTKNEIRAEVAEVLKSINLDIKDLKDRIRNLKTSIFDPLMGIERPIGSVVEMLRDYYRPHALTNYDYEQLNLTNNQYAALLLFNDQYTLEGIKYVARPKFKHLNPITGTYTDEYNVASWIATQCANTLTVDNYTAQDLTNDEYAAKDLTNQEYFFTQAADLPWA